MEWQRTERRVRTRRKWVRERRMRRRERRRRVGSWGGKIRM
jgi:hypothetical protein